MYKEREFDFTIKLGAVAAEKMEKAFNKAIRDTTKKLNLKIKNGTI